MNLLWVAVKYSLASKGLPDEFMTYATEQLAKVNAAYDVIEKHRRA